MWRKINQAITFTNQYLFNLFTLFIFNFIDIIQVIYFYGELGHTFLLTFWNTFLTLIIFISQLETPRILTPPSKEYLFGICCLTLTETFYLKSPQAKMANIYHHINSSNPFHQTLFCCCKPSPKNWKLYRNIFFRKMEI